MKPGIFGDYYALIVVRSAEKVEAVDVVLAAPLKDSIEAFNGQMIAIDAGDAGAEEFAVPFQKFAEGILFQTRF